MGTCDLNGSVSALTVALYLKFNPFTHSKLPKASRMILNGRMMHKHILGAVLRGDEPESFLVVEPLYSTFHMLTSPVYVSQAFEFEDVTS